VALYFGLAWFGPEPVRQAILPERLPDIVWLPSPGPGGGGGGGNQQPDPPRPAEVRERPRPQVSVPPPEPTPIPRVEDTPPETLNIPAQLQASAENFAIGAPAPNPPTDSTGSGRGTGAGSGRGSGLGPGSGGGTGGGVFRPGSGIENPRLVREVKPQYTAEAMRAKVQGSVVLECVVLADGGVGQCDVVKSLDSAFGLDQEAIKAARQWRFQPGTRFGQPVAVLVTIQLDFTLR
jgi:TonB family protein